MAAGVCLAMRDKLASNDAPAHGHMPAGQLLVYPATNFRMDSPSIKT